MVPSLAQDQELPSWRKLGPSEFFLPRAQECGIATVREFKALDSAMLIQRETTMNRINTSAIEPVAPATLEPTLQAIRDALQGLRYGQVTVIVQDGRVMQIDRTERHRLSTDRASS